MQQYPNPDWTIYPPHFSILQAVNKMHCPYANAVVQPRVQHYSCYIWHERQRFILDVDTATLV